MTKQDLTEQRFGSWTVLSPHSASRSGHTRWLCACDCGTTRDVLATHLVQGNSTSCGCARPTKAARRQWTGCACGCISGRFWQRVTRNRTQGKRSAIEVRLDIEDACQLFVAQRGRCALSGLPIVIGERHDDTHTASLDRIESDGHYELGNVQWVHKDVNLMKNTLSQERFIELCKAVAGACDLP